MTRRAGLFMALTILLSACTNRTEAPTSRVELDAEYRELTQGYNEETGARQISAADLRKLLAEGKRVVLIDVREANEQAVSTLANARRVAPDRIEDEEIDLDDDTTVVAYCTAGYRSGLAAVALEKRLGRPILNLDGGIIAWFNDGGEVVGPDQKPASEIHPFGDAWAKFVHSR